MGICNINVIVPAAEGYSRHHFEKEQTGGKSKSKKTVSELLEVKRSQMFSRLNRPYAGRCFSQLHGLQIATGVRESEGGGGGGAKEQRQSQRREMSNTS